MLLTDDEIISIAKAEGQKLAFKRNPNIDIDYARAIEQAVINKVEQKLMELHESSMQLHNYFHYAALQVTGADRG